MCWTCDHRSSPVDEFAEVVHIDDHRRRPDPRHLVATVHFRSGNPSVAYTTGLADFGLPELLVTGLAAGHSHTVLTAAARESVHGCPPAPGDRMTFHDGLLGEWVAVEHPDIHLPLAMAEAQQHVSALQLVWSDAAGRWPWDASFAEGRGGQPVLGIRSPDGWFDEWAQAG